MCLQVFTYTKSTHACTHVHKECANHTQYCNDPSDMLSVVISEMVQLYTNNICIHFSNKNVKCLHLISLLTLM